MEIMFAAIGGPGIDGGSLSEALHALARRSDLEEVGPSEVLFSVRLRSPRTGERGAWCPVELGPEEPVATLGDVARAIAAHLHRGVWAVAGVLEDPALGRIGYRAYEMFADGTKRTLSLPGADEACQAAVSESSADRSARLEKLFAELVEAGPIAADWPFAGPEESIGRTNDRSADPAVKAFRVRVVLDSPRLARLAATIIAAKTVWFTPDPSGRVRLKIDARDGGKQISFVSTDEAVTLQRATNRSWIAIEPV
ncbi:MAG TPA: hypothetical protein VM925_02235 [Labilithrix sp.]|nr:hypothetical protein [Labilithrix sp.]